MKIFTLKVIGLIWIIFWLWRTLLERMPQEITYRLLIISIVMISIYTCSIIIQVYLYKAKNKKPNIVSKVISYLINKLYWEPLKVITVEIVLLSNRLNSILYNVGIVISNYINTPNKIRKLIVIYTYITKGLFLITLYVDIVRLNQLKYIYVILPIMFIPLVVNSILFIINTFADVARNTLEESKVLIEYLPNNQASCTLKTTGIQDNINQWVRLHTINATMNAISLYRTEYLIFKQINILISYVFLIAWLCIFIKIIVPIYIVNL